MSDMFFEADALTNLNKGKIHEKFSSNVNWPYPGWNQYVVIHESNLQKAINLWFTNETEANATYGHISDWNISDVIDSIKVTSKAEGVTQVTSDPSSYNLMPVTDHEQALLDANQTAEQAVENAKTEGISTVTNDPSSYNLMTVADYEQAMLDANQTAQLAIENAKADGVTEGIQAVQSNPSLYNLVTTQSVQDDPSLYNLVTQEAYNDLLNSLDSNATPYTPDWFYIPDHGWMWSQKDVYPWFYDSNSSDWLYFQSGHDNPKFYSNKSEEWITLD